MMASTLHWWPTPGAYTGYHAPHREVLLRTLDRLPEPAALDDLVDMTHVRWILVRPAESWNVAAQRDRFLERLRRAPPIGRAFAIDDWVLFEVDREPQHPRWFETIARGERPAGTTVLGTSLTKLDPQRARGRIELGPVSPLEAGGVGTEAEIRNEGELPWPAVPPGPPLQLAFPPPKRPPTTLQVVVVAEWKPIDDRGEVGAVASREVVALDRDVDPGDTVRQTLSLAVPPAPGRYELEVSLQQMDGPRLDPSGPSSRTLVTVGPRLPPPRTG